MNTQNKYPIVINISSSIFNEWLIKEEGSYEDHGKPEKGHIYCLLCDNWNRGKLTINNDEEMALLKRSADYHTSWDAGENAIVDRLMKKASEIMSL